MKINTAGLDLIKHFEACRLEAYQDVVGVWTIGWGHTGDVKPEHKISQHQADVILEYDLDRFETGVSDLAGGVALTANQFAALVSFAFNCGLRNLSRSTLLRKVLTGDATGAANEFLLWCHAGGRVIQGLVKRRTAERDLFLTPDSN